MWHYIVSPKIIIWIFWGKNTLHCYLNQIIIWHQFIWLIFAGVVWFYFQVCNILKLLPNKKTFKTLKNVVSFSLGLCMEQLTFDLLKIFGLSSGSSRSSFRGRNTYTLSFGRLVLTNYKAEKFFLKFNSGKIWKMPRKKNFLNCLSKI